MGCLSRGNAAYGTCVIYDVCIDDQRRFRLSFLNAVDAGWRWKHESRVIYYVRDFVRYFCYCVQRLIPY
jgi:hypothetical protein